MVSKKIKVKKKGTSPSQAQDPEGEATAMTTISGTLIGETLKKETSEQQQSMAEVTPAYQQEVSRSLKIFQQQQSRRSSAIDTTREILCLEIGGTSKVGELHAIGEKLTVGRGHADLLLQDPSVSVIHCTFYGQEGVASVVDNGSSNGTYVDGRRIRPTNQILLNPQDTVLVGKIPVKIMVRPKDDPAVIFEREDLRLVLPSGGQPPSGEGLWQRLKSWWRARRIPKQQSETTAHARGPHTQTSITRVPEDEFYFNTDTPPREETASQVETTIPRKISTAAGEDLPSDSGSYSIEHDERSTQPPSVEKTSSAAEVFQEWSSPSALGELEVGLDHPAPKVPAPGTSGKEGPLKASGADRQAMPFKVRRIFRDRAAWGGVRLLANLSDFLLVLFFYQYLQQESEFALFWDNVKTLWHWERGTQVLHELLVGTFPQTQGSFLVLRELVQQHGGLVLLFIVFQMLCCLLLGVPLSFFMMGMQGHRGPFWNRLMGFIRLPLGWVLAPALIFDLPALLRRRTLKEVLTGTAIVFQSGGLLPLRWFLWPLLVVVWCQSGEYLLMGQRRAELLRPLPQLEFPLPPVQWQGPWQDSPYFGRSLAPAPPKLHLIPHFKLREKGEQTQIRPELLLYFEDLDQALTLEKWLQWDQAQMERLIKGVDPLAPFFYESLKEGQVAPYLLHSLQLRPSHFYEYAGERGINLSAKAKVRQAFLGLMPLEGARAFAFIQRGEEPFFLLTPDPKNPGTTPEQASYLLSFKTPQVLRLSSGQGVLARSLGEHFLRYWTASKPLPGGQGPADLLLETPSAYHFLEVYPHLKELPYSPQVKRMYLDKLFVYYYQLARHSLTLLSGGLKRELIESLQDFISVQEQLDPQDPFELALNLKKIVLALKTDDRIYFQLEPPRGP